MSFKVICVFIAGAAVGIGLLLLVNYVQTINYQNEQYKAFINQPRGYNLHD